MTFVGFEIGLHHLPDQRTLHSFGPGTQPATLVILVRLNRLYSSAYREFSAPSWLADQQLYCMPPTHHIAPC